MRGMNFELSLWSQLRYMNLYIHTRLYIKVYKLKRKTNGATTNHIDDRHRIEDDDAASRPRQLSPPDELRRALHGGAVEDLLPHGETGW